MKDVGSMRFPGLLRALAPLGGRADNDFEGRNNYIPFPGFLDFSKISSCLHQCEI